MMGIRVTIASFWGVVQKAVSKAAFKNTAHAAASLRKDVQRSLIPHPKPSRPGTPPHTRRGQLPRSILFAINEKSAVVGPRFSWMKGSAQSHEFGGEYRGRTLPERAYMFPGLLRAIPKFAGQFKGSIGE